VIVDDFYVYRIAVIPTETDAIPFVDADRLLSRAIAVQRFEPITRRNAELVQLIDRSYLEELSSRGL